MANEEVELNGFTIPKGTILFGSLYLIMNDPAYFENPSKFTPER